MRHAIERLCLALDRPGSLARAVELVNEFKWVVGVVKVNAEFVAHHRDLLDIIHRAGIRSWVDLKLHDIPSAVQEEVVALKKLGVSFVTIHLSGGSRMIDTAVVAAGNFTNEPDLLRVLGVTVLTSIDKRALNKELRIPGEIEDHVLHLAKLGKRNGVHGVVCSGREAAVIRKRFGQGFFIATPGIRFSGDRTHDHERVATPTYAVRNGSDLIVMGRELIAGGITAAHAVLGDIAQGLAEVWHD